MTKNDNKYIIEFGLKILFNKIKDISILNKNLDNKLNSYVEFIINRIFKYDELFTNFNYAELKQMFTENAPNFINYDIDEIDNDGNDELEVDDLFSYSNVDIEFGDVED
jgi:ankyrin repeat protein